MADDQFSLYWDNFNNNLVNGFYESLCSGELVDVTLVAEGQFVEAHRLVLSVCSPYFRKMFTHIPINQHAIVFLKDVSYTALRDLIQFIYCGEINIKQDALPVFISTAEALQVKGWTDTQSVHHALQSHNTNLLNNLSQEQHYFEPDTKTETQKRLAQSFSNEISSSKRVRSTALTAAEDIAQTTKSCQKTQTENIQDFHQTPIFQNIVLKNVAVEKSEQGQYGELTDLSKKPEHSIIDYAVNVKHSFFERKSDENILSFLDENRCAVNKPHLELFERISALGRPSKIIEVQGGSDVEYTTSRRGTQLVVHKENTYTPNEKFRLGQKSRDWKCSMYYKAKCPARLVTMASDMGETIRVTCDIHTHPPMLKKENED